MMSGINLTRGVLSLVLFLVVGSATAAGGPALVEAAKKQDWGTVDSLLKDSKADINAAQGDGTTALAWAVYWDNLDAARRLIAAKANVNLATDIGVTPLMLATRNRNAGMVEALLKAGAKPDVAMWSGETPLMTAAREGLTDIVSILLDHGADAESREPRRGQTALMWAISFLHPDTARLLIEKGADVHAKTYRLKEKENYSAMRLEGYAGVVESIAQGGYTPLMFAARAGDLDTARLLVGKGARVNDVSVEDGPALVIASAYGYEDMALFLLEKGADPNIADANGMTALHYAFRDGLKLLHGYEIVSAKRICGYAADSRCKAYDTVSEEEKKLLDDPAVGLYIVEGEVDTNDPTLKAAKILPGGNMYELAEALLARGANVDAEMKYPPPRLRLDSLPWLNLEGATPFFLASASLDASAMDMLLEHGANPLVSTEVNHDILAKQTKTYADDNQILGNGSSLMVAVGLGKKNDFTPEEERRALDAAKRLVELGADVKEATATGWTALHAAAFLGANSIIKYLVEQGAEVDARTGCGRTPLSLAYGENAVGLLDRPVAHETTAELLLQLGAGKKDLSPTGDCILGRGGLDVDLEFRKQFNEVKQEQKESES